MPLLASFIVPHPPLIVPEIGKGQERSISSTGSAYREIARRISGLHPDVVIISTPHSTVYADYIHISPGQRASGGLTRFGAPSVRFSVEYDEVLVQTITASAARDGIPAGTLGERDRGLDHGTMIPLHFLRQEGVSVPIVRIALSGLSHLVHYRFGQCVSQAIEQLGRRAVFVASGDLSHKLIETGPYGFSPQGPEFDRRVVEAMKKGDFAEMMALDESFCESAAECGLRSFLIMAGALDGLAVVPEVLSYEGPFGVGYAVASFSVQGKDSSRDFAREYANREAERLRTIREKEDAYVRLARQSLETFVTTGKRIGVPPGTPEEMLHRRAGVFVSLHRNGKLRGCIGTIRSTTENVAEEIIRNAIHAATEDPRFDPVTSEELADLECHVDVLGPSEPVLSMNELDPKRYGVIVRNRGRSGLLLPDLPGVDTVEEQIAIARRKAGIGENESVDLERFEVVRHQ
jgi:AmmeMemoRadiSam system protein A/AmmeMemoRadiSam system protein B